MTNDLPARLREQHVSTGESYLQEAADAIELLSAEAARYRWLRLTRCFTMLEEVFGVDPARNPDAELDALIDGEIAEYRREAAR
jgi:hypothetical protein